MEEVLIVQGKHGQGEDHEALIKLVRLDGSWHPAIFKKIIVVDISGRLVSAIVPSLELNLKESMCGCGRRAGERVPEAKVPQGLRNTNLVAVCETKGIEVRDTDVGTVLLHPGISSHLARNLLINSAGLLLLGELVGHGAKKDKASGLGLPAGVDIDEDAKIEAALYPRVWRQNDAAVFEAQMQMVSDHSSNRLGHAANLWPKTLDSALVLKARRKLLSSSVAV